MDDVEVSTVVYLPPEEVYEFLIDFPRYARYSKYLTDVRQNGDGSTGTEYDLRFEWWKLGYTARSKVTGRSPPDRIDWALVKDIDARGYWQVDHVPDRAPDDRETASRVRLRVEYDPDSARSGALDLPVFVSFGWLMGTIKPKIVEEARRVVERIVADLEGEHREVELTIHSTPDAV